MSIISEWFKESHNEDFEEAKFKIGETVIYNPLETHFPEFIGKEFIVTGSSWNDDDPEGNPIIEYSLQGFPYLVWENELEEKVDLENCSHCGAPKSLYKCEYCGSKK